ncbi:ribonuclease III [Lenzites betulinus]|nr:ribonuclease III [Lenzites betulinus]
MTDFYAKVFDPPRVLAAVTSDPERWPSLDLSRLELSFSARTFFLKSTTADVWLGPLELVLEYDPPSLTQPGSVLALKLREADSEHSILQPRHLRRSGRVLSQLGLFAFDLFWKTTLDHLLNSTSVGQASEDSGPARARQRLAELRNTWPDRALAANLHVSTCNVTPKVAKLVEVLLSYSGVGDDFRGIVFVKDRSVASTLAALLQNREIGLPFIRATEVRHGAAGDPNYQRDLRQAFGSGQYNMLVLTRSAQDLDLPPASTVISFDLFEDQLTYAYCQARSRGKHSHLIHLVEKDNNEQRRVLTQMQAIDTDIRNWIAGFARGEGKDFPPKSLHTTLDPCLSDSEDEETDGEFIVDATTSARIYRADAEAAVHRFVASFGEQIPGIQDAASISLDRHASHIGGEGYSYTISLPKATGIPDISGPYCQTKVQARREAFYRTCQECVQRGLMDYRHFPQTQWRPAGDASSEEGESSVPQDVKTASSSSATHGYPRKFPDLWANSYKRPATTLYPTVVIPENLADQPHAPVVLLTRVPLPQIPAFFLFYVGARTTVRLYKGEPFEVSAVQLEALRGYTNRVVRSLTNKPFPCAAENVLGFLAPLNAAWQPYPTSPECMYSPLPVAGHIPWDAIQLAADYFAVPLSSNLTSLDDNARDAVVQDRNVEFTMRHFLVTVRHDLTPLSKVNDSPREAEFPNFLEYCKARRKDFAGLEDEKQPMVEVAAVPAVINNLHPMCTPQTPPAKVPLKYLIPELTYKFTIPASTFRTLWLMPSVMAKTDSYLLVKELDAKLFHHSISEQQLLVALSTRAAWTEHNYERLEFLGDAFLKVVASNFLYVTMPGAGEGELHTARQGIIGNKVLHECAMRLGICPYIQHKRVVAKLWQPPHIPAAASSSSSSPSGKPEEEVEMADAEGDGASEGTDGKEDQEKGQGKSKKRTKRQRQLYAQNILWMGDKVVADVVEAILAAAFLSGGHERALQAARKLLIPLPNIAQWTDFARIGAQHSSAAPTTSSQNVHASTVEAVQALVGSVFSKPELLVQALTHQSAFGSNEGASYERLEFIGDAILDFLVARHIFERHPHLSPGGLTLLKGGMVSNRALAAFCVHTGLHAHLRFASEQLDDAIRRYAGALAALRQSEYAAAAREERLPGQYWLDVPMEPPKCLSDLVESVVGALYVCDGFFEVGVGRFFDAAFKPFMDAHVRLHTLSANPKVTLLELLQAEGCRQHAVLKVPQERQNAPVHMEGALRVHGELVASATDLSAAIATRKVALAALDALTNDPELLPRICDCGSGEGTKKPQPQPEESTQDDAEAAEVEEAMEVLEGAE